MSQYSCNCKIYSSRVSILNIIRQYIMGKQKLSPKAAKAKAERDLAYANTDDRKAKRADSQMKRRKAIKNKGLAFLINKDYDHNTGRFVLSSHNRGGTQSKDKKDGTKAEKNNK